MISIVIFDNIQNEEKAILRLLKDLTAYYSEEVLNIAKVHSFDELKLHIRSAAYLDLAFIDVTLPGGIAGAKEVRQSFSNAEIVIIADISISPVQYMHPLIKASSLLLRPATDYWRNLLEEFYILLLKKMQGSSSEILRIMTKDGVIRVKYKNVLYLEAREKKIFVRTSKEEYGIKGSIEKFEKQLPGNFVRCHRSYIVNMDYVVRIKLADNTLFLAEELMVPVSRSYKEVFKTQI